MSCDALVYAFYRYVLTINPKKSKKITSIFPNLNDENYKNSYNIAIKNSLETTQNKKIYKLKNIFSNNSYIKFDKLNFDETFYIRNNDSVNNIDEKIWNDYIDKVIVKINNAKNDSSKLYYILLKYLSNVPAVNKDNCKISLFDICKLTAAIYNCLKKKTQKCILIKGDLSGIQNFIYKTEKDNALRFLKGRSLYLSLLQDLCSKCIVRELNLDICNILYSGGGNFYILASEYDIEKFKEIRKSISKILFHAHNNELYLALASYSFNAEELNSKIKEIWKNINNEVGLVKQRRWSELELENDDNFKKIFGPIGDAGRLEESCKICGRKIKNSDDEKCMCDFCLSFKDLIDTKECKYYTEEDIGKLTIQDSYDSYNDVFLALGYNIEFSNTKNIKHKERVYRINNLNEEDVDGYIFKSIKVQSNSLDEIAISDNELGDNNIGVIKLDVDYLGTLFIETEEIGQVMGLSRNISMFFEGYVENALLNNYFNDNDIEKALMNNSTNKKNINLKEKISIIYAGGDDTFIVGRYDEVLRFALVLRTMFEKYVDNNNITFTAGVGMFSPNFPILMSANVTEKFLESGKNMVDKDNKKDKISFMGEVFTWKQFKKLIILKDKIENIYNATNNKSIFDKINNSTLGFKAVFKEGKGINYLKLHRLAYYLRDIKIDNSELIEDLVDEYQNLCIEALKTKDKCNIAMIIPYANKWAQCNCRKL